MKLHYLKTNEHPFRGLWTRQKTHEVRLFDRLFEEGDWLILQEFFEGEYSGRAVLAKIGYLLPPGTWGQSESHGSFSLLHMQNFDKDDDPLSVLV